MFDIGLQEMLVIGVLALLVFGPSKLPELGRMVGRALREFRRASDEFRSTVETNLHMNEPDQLPPLSEPPPAAAVDETSSAVATTAALPSETEAALVESGSAVVAVEDTGDPFCAARTSKIFHRRDCRWARRIPETERRTFTSVKEARDEGFGGCPVCEPPEASEST